jgi:hypothetical protein
MSFWISEARQGITDFTMIASRIRELQTSFAAIIAEKFNICLIALWTKAVALFWHCAIYSIPVLD